VRDRAAIKEVFVREPDSSVVSPAMFEEALPGLRPDLHRYCSRMTGSVIEGEDVLQSALMKAFEALARGDRVDNLRAWLFRIAHNTALDALRARKRETAMIDHNTPPEETPATLPERSEVTDSLRPFLALTPGQRSSVILRDVFGYSTAEVAGLTDGTIASVKAALHRGRAALKQSRENEAKHPPEALSESRARQLTLYARLFNERNFDQLRDMLSAEVRLDLVSRTRMAGKQEVGTYFGNYAKVSDWLMVPGRVEGRAALLAFDPDDTVAGPIYFVLLDFEGDGLVAIQDFRYARYAMAEAEWELHKRPDAEGPHLPE
jgi:RNA polymerase sigma-70 factor (ECF subfamily)